MTPPQPCGRRRFEFLQAPFRQDVLRPGLLSHPSIEPASGPCYHRRVLPRKRCRVGIGRKEPLRALLDSGPRFDRGLVLGPRRPAGTAGAPRWRRRRAPVGGRRDPRLLPGGEPWTPAAADRGAA